MSISNMQDIAGVRVVLPNMALLNAFKQDCEKTYKQSNKKQNFVIHPVGEEDKYNYIDHPKIDGYRSLHQVYKFQNLSYPELNGLPVELQIRTQMQHSWATSVETLGTILNTPFKTGRGDEHYREFFKLCSALFSHKENTPRHNTIAHLTEDEIINKIILLNREHGVTDLLKSAKVLSDRLIQRNIRKDAFYLVETDLDKKEVRYMMYTPDQIEEAEYAYNTKEKEVLENKLNWVVSLISIDNIENLRKTYPNFYLDSSEFINHLEKYNIN